MILIATVNGVKVFSDKRFVSVVDNVVRFADGSFCDVRTNQIVNKGPGSINLGVSGEDESPVETIEKKSNSGKLRIENIAGCDLSINVGSDQQIVAKLTGPGSAVAKIDFDEIGDTFTIKGPQAEEGSSVTIVSGGRGCSVNRVISSIGRGSVAIGANFTSVAMNDSVSPRSIQLEITIPVGMPINISNVDGNILIGDTLGPVRLLSRESTEATIGRITDLRVNKSGMGKVKVRAVDGNVNINMSGMGNLIIDGGKIEMLEIAKSGMGNVNVNAQVVDAEIDCSGMGDVYVKSVTGNLHKSSSGMGGIQIGNR